MVIVQRTIDFSPEMLERIDNLRAAGRPIKSRTDVVMKALDEYLKNKGF